MKNIILSIATITFLLSCTKEPVAVKVSSDSDSDWIILKNEVYNGGPGKDGIPSIEEPHWVSISEVSFMEDDDLVVVFSDAGDKLIYPHRILEWHEIVNDAEVTISYCPLTGSAIGLRPFVESGNSDVRTTFGVSGLLYNSNLILYDRFSDSYWSQMKNQCVAGPLKRTFPTNEILVETTYKTAIEMFPDALVLSDNTGIYSATQYRKNAYGSYSKNDWLSFPVNNEDSRVPRKERVMGVVFNNNALVLRLNNLPAGVNVINTRFSGESIVMIADYGKNYSVAYKKHFAGSSAALSFSAVQQNGQAVFADNLGNQYNILGEVVSGPNSSERLQGTHSYIAYWFAWAAFYHDLKIY